MAMTISYQNTSPLEEQVKNRFKQANLSQEYTRAMMVRSHALSLAAQYGLDKDQVSAAALLHNISRLIQPKDYLATAEEYGTEILPAERQNPYLLHQKISRILAVEEFNISDKEVLNAISCQTTLRPSATLLDKIIFIASKQNSEQFKNLNLQNNKKAPSEQELNKSIFNCLFNEINDKSIVSTVHPWAKGALEELKTKLHMEAI